MHRGTVAALGCLAILTVGPATADAATRYAVPGGAGSTGCTSVANDCSFKAAVEGAGSGDIVSVLAGTHTLPGRVAASTGVTIEGQPGPRPLVQGPDPGPGYGLLDLQGSDILLSHLDLRFTGPSDFALVSLQSGTGGLLRDLVITNSGTSAAVLLYDGTMDTVVVRSTGTAFSDVAACTSTMRNVTFTGGADYAVNADAALCGPIALTMQNTLARGTSGDIFLSAFSDGMTPDRPVALNIDHSNYRTVVKSSGAPDSLYTINASANQDAEPQLVNLTLGDIHQLPGSPTIDAGTAGAIGATDIDGQPRITGAAPDIGADERPPPDVPGGSTDVTDPVISGAKLSHKRFRVSSRAAATGRRLAPKGTTFSYTLSERSDVTIRFARRTRGVRIKRPGQPRLACVRTSRANRRALSRQLSRRPSIKRLSGRERVQALNRAARKRRCALYRSVGRISRTNLGPGPVKTRFSGRIGARALKPADYRAELVATDTAGNASAPRRLAFKVVKRR